MANLAVICGKAAARLPGPGLMNIGGLQYLTFGAGKDSVVGNPTAPSLALKYASTYRFRWVLHTGVNILYVNCLQAINLMPRPTVTAKANPDIGINADVSATAPSGTGWVTIGPVSVTASAAGAVYVWLTSNTTSENAAPCYFDHLVAT